jgi:hypothetical protein
VTNGCGHSFFTVPESETALLGQDHAVSGPRQRRIFRMTAKIVPLTKCLRTAALAVSLLTGTALAAHADRLGAMSNQLAVGMTEAGLKARFGMPDETKQLVCGEAVGQSFPCRLLVYYDGYKSLTVRIAPYNGSWIVDSWR